jgi:hypothetical protein
MNFKKASEGMQRYYMQLVKARDLWEDKLDESLKLMGCAEKRIRWIDHQLDTLLKDLEKGE